jgi:hypothetical protein
MVQSVGLGIQSPDFGTSLARGMQLRAAGEQRENENMLRAMLADPATAQGVLAGDPTMLARLAGMGTQGLQVAAPLMAQAGQRQYQQDRLAMDRERLAQEIAHRRASLAQAAMAQNADPAAVREWQHFNSLSPEDQSRYLLMKRAQPFLNTGTAFVRPDAVTGEPAATVDRDVRGEASEREIGKAEGERIAAAPREIAVAERNIGLVDAAINHPALRAATGILSWTQYGRGTPMYDFGQRMKQIEGTAFLQAFQDLKGGGHITEIEGIKATQAIARLSSGQSAEDLRQSLRELRELLEKGRESAQRAAAMNARNPAPSPQAPGTIPGPGGVGTAEPPAPRVRVWNPATGRLE